jgi:hypothetical protein
MRSLRAVDTAYASGNAAEARTRFAEARSAWNGIAPMISACEAQLLFETLGNQLRSGAPATRVKSTVAGMLDELRFVWSRAYSYPSATSSFAARCAILC